MSTYRLKIEGKTFEVDLKSLSEGTATVQVGDNTYEVEIDRGAPVRVAPIVTAPSAQPARPQPPAASQGNANEIRAPMPGLILDIMVKEGDSVTARQAVVKMETMKMENEIRAPRAGVIASIQVSARDDVDQGQVLVTLEQ